MRSPRKFRKKPVVIEAMRFTGATVHDVYDWLDAEKVDWSRSFNGNPLIKTTEGGMLVTDGDWVIKGTRGEFYPCKPGPFRDTFEEVPSIEETQSEMIAKVVSQQEAKRKTYETEFGQDG